MRVSDRTGDNTKKQILLDRFPEMWKILHLETLTDSKYFQMYWAKILELTKIDLIWFLLFVNILYSRFLET